jgi:hypothetical protein
MGPPLHQTNYLYNRSLVSYRPRKPLLKNQAPFSSPPGKRGPRVAASPVGLYAPREEVGKLPESRFAVGQPDGNSHAAALRL